MYLTEELKVLGSGLKDFYGYYLTSQWVLL